MSIRSRLLAWLLPAVVILTVSINFAAYYNWYLTNIKSFQKNLLAIVENLAGNMNADDIMWIKEHARDPQKADSPIYQSYYTKLHNIYTDLPIMNLYIFNLEPVKKGETVLLDEPKSHENPIYDGKVLKFAYREAYLLELRDPLGIPHKNFGFVEPAELTFYQTKDAFITPIKQTGKFPHRFMSGVAPIFDQNGFAIAWVGADLNVEIFDTAHRYAMLASIAATLLTITLVSLAAYFIANKISKPVQHLNIAALEMAAGDYEEDIRVKGPKEITELSNTLNTLRECLLENNSKLRDASLTREKLYGEYECAHLLQHRMIDKVLEDYKDPRFEIRSIAYSASTNPQGILLDVLSSTPLRTIMSLRESNEEGFEGIYQLLREDVGDSIRFEFNHDTRALHFSNHTMPNPFVWSTQGNRALMDEKLQFTLESGDYFVLASKGLSRVLIHQKLTQEWYSKVFRHFAKEGPDLLAAMLTSELNFLAKKQHVLHDIHILCFHYK